jgi:hypothetical protein
MKMWQVVVDGTAHYFENKDAAKPFRNQHPGSVVSKGPEHPRLNDKGNQRTHSHKMNDPKGDGFRRTKRRKA